MKALKGVKSILGTEASWKLGEILFTFVTVWIGGYLVGSGKEGLKGCETESALMSAQIDKNLAEINAKGFKMLYELKCKELEELKKEVADK